MLGDLRGSFSSVRNVISGTMIEYFTRTLQELYKSLNNQFEHVATDVGKNRLKTLTFVL